MNHKHLIFDHAHRETDPVTVHTVQTKHHRLSQTRPIFKKGRQGTCKHNIEARSRNPSYRGKSVRITLHNSECVTVALVI